MPGPEGCPRRVSRSRKCCGPTSTNSYICERCKQRPCCRMHYVCSCCIAKYGIQNHKFPSSFERTELCAHRAHSEVILSNHENAEENEEEKVFDKSRFEEREREDIKSEREKQTNTSIVESRDAQIQATSAEEIGTVNEFNWNEKDLVTQNDDENSKLTTSETLLPEEKLLTPPPNVWNISEGKSTVPTICYKTEWYLENTKEFVPGNSCECELCRTERSKDSSFKKIFNCCKKEKTVYTKYRKVPAPDLTESEDEKFDETWKKKVAGGKYYQRKNYKK